MNGAYWKFDRSRKETQIKTELSERSETRFNPWLAELEVRFKELGKFMQSN